MNICLIYIEGFVNLKLFMIEYMWIVFLVGCILIIIDIFLLWGYGVLNYVNFNLYFIIIFIVNEEEGM